MLIETKLENTVKKKSWIKLVLHLLLQGFFMLSVQKKHFICEDRN